MSRRHRRYVSSVPICIAIHGCGSLEQISSFIKRNRRYVDPEGTAFSAEQLAAQYAFEQAKLDRKGYDTRRICKYLSLLTATGVSFNVDRALQYADDFINFYTADFGQDEDGEATFRIRSQTFRLKTYDCWALWARVDQADLVTKQVLLGNFAERDEISEVDNDLDFLLDFTVQFSLIDKHNGPFALISRYVTSDNGNLCVEDLVDFEFMDYPNFHDESETMVGLIKEKCESYNGEAIAAVTRYLGSCGIEDLKRHSLAKFGLVPQKILTSLLTPALMLRKS